MIACRAVLLDTSVTSYMCLFKLIRKKLEIQSSVALVPFQVLISHMRSVVTMLGSAVIEHAHHHSKSDDSAVME